MAGTGICGQLGFVNESTVGTAVTVTKFIPVDKFEMDLDPIIKKSEGVRACAQVPYAGDSVSVGTQVSGKLEADLRSKTIGLLLKQMIGSSAVATIVGAGPLYRQTHVLGDFEGKSLTMQAGYPESYGSFTKKPFTYRGCKVTGWELSNKMDELAKMSLDLDAWAVSTATALASATYATNWECFHWDQFTLTVGGTASTAAGRTTVSGGTAIKGVKGVTFSGKNGMAVDRRFAGNAGVKSEQLENALRSVGGKIDAEFADQAQLYDLFAAHTTTVIEGKWTGTVDLGSSNFASLRVTFPQAKIIGGNPHLAGPDVIPLDGLEFEGLADDAGTHPALQIELESGDTAL